MTPFISIIAAILGVLLLVRPDIIWLLWHMNVAQASKPPVILSVMVRLLGVILMFGGTVFFIASSIQV